MEASTSDLRQAIREHAPKTTVSRLAERGIQRCRVVPMETLEALFQKALERALERSLARMPAPVRTTLEREAREELRELLREELARARADGPDEGVASGRQVSGERPSERKRALLEIVFQENLVLQKKAS